MQFYHCRFKVVCHAHNAFGANKLHIRVVCLVFRQLPIYKALCDVEHDTVFKRAMTLQPPRLLVAPHTHALSVPCSIFAAGIPACNVNIVHAAVVKAGALIFVTFAWRQSWCHVAHTNDGQFAQFALVNKTSHGLVIPRVAQIQVHGRQHMSFLGGVNHLPFALYGVGDGFL